MPVVELPELLSREEAAKVLGVSDQTLANWACTGRVQLPFVRIGKFAKYRRSDVLKFIERNVVRAGTSKN